ncbi:hypothetical protein JCM10207_006169 [Rhodosporidiobolus poonsookiae]
MATTPPLHKSLLIRRSSKSAHIPPEGLTRPSPLEELAMSNAIEQAQGDRSRPGSRRSSFTSSPLSSPYASDDDEDPLEKGRRALLSRRSSRSGHIGMEGLTRPSPLQEMGQRPSSAPNREAVAEKETQFIGALDCGTTSCRFYIFDQWADVVANHQIEFDQLHPEPGWHEHNPETYTVEIDKCIESCMRQFKEKGHEADELKGVGIATQRETTLLWRKSTGKKIYNAIAWPDARNTPNVREIRAKAETRTFHTPDGEIVGEEGIRRLTGLPLSTYFSATKWVWLLENIPEVKEAVDADDLMMGTVDTWLVYQYTGGHSDGGIHITDASNACRTLLYDLHSQSWSDELCDFFDVPQKILPTVVSNSEVYGKFRKGHILEGVPIAGLIGDQQAALVGNKCLTKGDAKQTYGTGCFMLYNTGTDIVKSTHGLVTTVGYKMGANAPLHYALEGSVAVGGSSVQWLRDNLGIIEHPREAGYLAEQVEDTGGVYFVTGFSGLFAPYWDMRATGMMIGLSTFTTKHHIARATLEATCFQTRAILEAMAKDTAMSASTKKTKKDDDAPAGLKTLQVDGGMTGSDVTMQMQADILGVSLQRPLMRESTVLGAALLAGAALGLFGWDLSKPETIAKVNRLDVRMFDPAINEEEREWKYSGWVRAVDRARGWKTNSGHG